MVKKTPEKKEKKVKEQDETATLIVDDVEPLNKDPSIISKVSSTIFGEVRAIFYKTIVLEVGRGFVKMHRVIETKAIYLKCKGKTFKRVTDPLIQVGKGNHLYFVNEGEDSTTSLVDLKRDRFKNASDFVNNKLRPDLTNDISLYEAASELQKTMKLQPISLMLVIFVFFSGVGGGIIYMQATEQTGDSYDISGDYAESKIINQNPDTINPPPGNDDGTVVIQ